MNKILGLVNFENDRIKIEGLSDYRSVAATSVLGRYRLVDFVVSNMVNSGIDKIRVIAKDKPRSLAEHLGDGGQYDLNSKTRSLSLLYADNNIGNGIYYTDFAIVNQYMVLLKEASEEYVVIAPSYMVCTVDYEKVVEAHIKSGAEITCVYKEIEDGSENFIGCDEFRFIEGTNRIQSISMSHGSIDIKNISLETYVLSKDRFVQMVEDGQSLSSAYTLRDYLLANTEYFDMRGYCYNGYLRCINSLEQYYKMNMELLDYKMFKTLFNKNWPIYTKTNDSTPAFYSSTARVKNSLIANGSVIQGRVENSVVGRGAKIKRGAIVKNSIISPGALISADSVIEYAVVDKSAKVQVKKEFIGSEDNLIYIRRRDIV